MITKRTATLYIARIAMMSALSYALMFFKVPFFPPFNFYKFEFGNVPVMMTAMAMGPWSGALVALIKCLLYLPIDISETVGVGILSNFILSLTYALVCGYVYKIGKNRKFAAIGLGVGALATIGVACLSNWFLIFDMFKLAVNFDVKAVFGAKAIYAGVLPFNLMLTTAIGLVTFTLYKAAAKYVLKGDTMFGIGKRMTPAASAQTAAISAADTDTASEPLEDQTLVGNPALQE